MRIGLDVSKAAPPRDGIGNFTYELLRGLMPRFGDGGDELLLYAPTASRASEPEALLEALGPLPRKIRWRGVMPCPEDSLDLYHSTAWHVPAGLKANAGPRCPLLFTCYDLTFFSHPDCHTWGNKVHCAAGLLTADLHEAHFLAISQDAKQQLQQALGVAAHRIDVIYPAAASHFVPLDKATVRQRLADRLQLHGGFLLAVGTVEPRKNLLRLLEAYGRLDASLRQPYPLLLAGGAGWQDASELDRVLARPELSNVRRLGRVDDEMLLDLYNGATAFAYPSLAEGFGLPVVEAMACGTAVLTSSVSATAEVAGDAALLVDPDDVGAMADGLNRLLQDDALRRRLVEAGLRRAAEFSWQTAAKETQTLYHRLDRRR